MASDNSGFSISSMTVKTEADVSEPSESDEMP